MGREQIVVAGGGAAGFFAAIACARANRECDVSLFERSRNFFPKSGSPGGGRCNVTHALFEPRDFTTRYPRGERELISLFHRFSAEDTVAWFETRGVRLKREEDGRMFPVTDSSQTIIDCLLAEAKTAGVRLFTRTGIESARVRAEGGFDLKLNDGRSTSCDRLLLATGGCRSIGGVELARSLGHTIEPPVPSLFSLHVSAPWLRSLPGISVSDVELSVGKLRERGPLLVTHNGISGPVVLRLSAWGARVLHKMNYRFTLRVNWIPEVNEAALRSEFQSRRQTQPNRHVSNSPIDDIPARLWEKLVSNAGISAETIWTSLTRAGMNELVRQLRATELEVDGKSLNKDEFVTCGGVRLREINFKTMESRLTPGLYFAGELLDIDGITGGFNFQAAWTTGWIAGHAMAGIEHMKRTDKMQTALEEVRNVYVDLARRPIERNCTRQTECCHFKLTGRTPYLTKGEAIVAAKALRASGRKSLPENVDGSCPMLARETGNCLIYEDRPFGCRTHFCAAAGGPFARSEVIDLIRRLEDVDLALNGNGPRILQNAVAEALGELR